MVEGIRPERPNIQDVSLFAGLCKEVDRFACFNGLICHIACHVQIIGLFFPRAREPDALPSLAVKWACCKPTRAWPGCIEAEGQKATLDDDAGEKEAYQWPLHASRLLRLQAGSGKTERLCIDRMTKSSIQRS